MKINTSRKGKKGRLHIYDIKLTMKITGIPSQEEGDLMIILVISVAQRLLKSQFLMIKGLNSNMLQVKKTYNSFENNKIQIIHSRGDH